MRRIIDVLSILGLVAAPISIGLVYSQTHAPQAVVVPLNQTRVIKFEADEGFKRLSDRQQMDQLRDWLLFTVISDEGLSAKEINQSMYDLPTVRYGYMSPVSNFEYGATRSLYIGNGQVVALVPKSASPAERRDDLAHIADQYRKDQGKMPTSVDVFEYEISSEKLSALLTRREVVDGQKLFSSDYSYHEAQIQSLDDLQGFMSQVDDVTFAQVNGSSLTLGGRKISKYQGIRVEDVAAIWQSEKKIERQLADFKDRWEQKLRYLPPSDQETALQQAWEERRKLKLVDGSGFSLDPAYNYLSLQNFLKKAKPYLKELASSDRPAITEQDIQQAELGLSQNNEVPYLVLVDKLSKSTDYRSRIFGEWASLAGKTSSFQTARYDGDLQGTEVGMVLFYTDLLAKLWALNYLGTTPYQVIPDFNPLTKIKVSSIYKREIEALPNTRLWFGSQDRGFQVANGGGSLLFARNATRIYAASSNPLNPGVETTAAANTDAFLSWWNDHYEEVARYEPQYERLNQIMKWSLVINWLNQSNRSELLGFLQGVSVRRDNWFPNWVKAQGDRLRFQHWNREDFFERGYKGTKTEAMPLLFSESYQRFGQTRQFRGGVTLANKSTFKGRSVLPTTSEIGELGKRSNLNYSSVESTEGKLKFKTLDETTYNLNNLDGNHSQTTAQAKAEARFRSPDAEVANQVFSRRVSQTSSGLQIDTTIGNTELGTFSVNKTGNGFTVGFLGRDLDTGHSLGLRLSRDKRPIETVLKESDDVQVVMKSGTQPPDYIVKMYDSKRWLKITEEPKGGGSGGSQPPSKPPKDGQFFVGDLGDGSRNFRLLWLDDAKVKQLQDAGDVERIHSKSSGKEEVDYQGSGDNLQNPRYQQVTQKLVEEPIKFLQLHKIRFQVELKKIDRLIKAGKDAKAAQWIDNLINFYGPEPNLMWRKAVVEIRQGRLNAQQVVPNDLGVDPSKSKQNFLNEINQLLENSDGVKRIETDTEFIYGQNSPGFNNLDFKVPIEQSIPSGSGARVYKLLPGEIGKVKLHLSGLGDASASFHASTQFQGSNPANTLRNLFQTQPGDDQCNENSENADCPKEKPTYVVIMPDNA